VSIRLKIIGIAVLTIALYGGLDFLLQRTVIQPSFKELEREQARRDMARCVQALRREAQHLSQFCLDWSARDDTYDYAAAPAAVYEERNLTAETFRDNKLNLLYIVHASGKVIWGDVYDLESEQPISLPDFSRTSWGSGHPLLRHAKAESTISGILLTSRGPMLVASQPIVRGDLSGEIQGAVVMGRFLDEAYLGLLSEQTQVRMRLVPLDAAPPSQDAPATLRLALQGPFDIREAGQRLEVAAVIPDAYGKPAFRLLSETPRETMAEGAAAMRLHALGAVASGLLVLLLLLLLLRQLVIDPLSRVTAHVGRIAESGELLTAADAGRLDEFGQLSQAFNRMVERLRHDNEVRAQAQDALRESEQRFQNLLTSLDDVVWSATLDAGSLLYMNPAAEVLFGRPPAELGQHMDAFARYVHPDYRDVVAEKRCFLRASDHVEMEYPIIRASGEVRWVRDRRAVVSDERGRRLRIVGVLSDITDLKLMYETMSRNRHLAELGEAGASVAHEIRNPLAGISGALQVIRTSLPAEDPRREAIREALEQVARVEKSVQQLLLYSRPWEPKWRREEVRAWLRGVCAAIRDRHGLRDGDIVVAEGPDFSASFDPALMEQVLENLVQNAHQAMPGGGRVTIEATETGAGFRVEVRDFGPGIAEADLPHIFEPFFTTKARGTGLGLSICRRILEAHGGSIQAVNIDGGGTKVVLQLPGREQP